MGDAREKALAFRQKLSLGIDPKDEIKRRWEQEAELAPRPTLAALFDTYIPDLEIDGKCSAREVPRIFNKHIRVHIGGTIVAEVITNVIPDVLTPIVRRGSPVHAHNMRAYLRAASEFVLSDNSVANTKKALKRKTVGRRALSAEGGSLVWHE